MTGTVDMFRPKLGMVAAGCCEISAIEHAEGQTMLKKKLRLALEDRA